MHIIPTAQGHFYTQPIILQLSKTTEALELDIAKLVQDLQSYSKRQVMRPPNPYRDQ